MLGLPASQIPRAMRNHITNVTMVDIRSGEEMIMYQSAALVNNTHSYALLVEIQNKYIAANCNLLTHRGFALNAFYESMTYACDFNYPIHQLSKRFRVDVLLAPKNLERTWRMNKNISDSIQLNGVDKPFHIDGKGSNGLFNSVVREHAVSNPQGVGDNSIGHIPQASACLTGVDYASPQHREVIQYYISIGFEHIYLGLPLWPGTALFNETWSLLQDFVMDGNLSIIVSEYARDFIHPQQFGKNFTYAPEVRHMVCPNVIRNVVLLITLFTDQCTFKFDKKGHKSSYVNTCLLAARAAGDDLVFVGDIDELIEYKYGTSTTIGEAVMKQLSLRNISLSQTCGIVLGSLAGYYHPDKVGYSDTSRIKNKLAAVGNASDSVAYYGKTILNPKRVLRTGLHGPAYCEAIMWSGSENVTRYSWIDDDNLIRPDINNIRTLHLRDSFKQRSLPHMIKDANALEKKYQSYFVRDFSSMVALELERRDIQTQHSRSK